MVSAESPPAPCPVPEVKLVLALRLHHREWSISKIREQVVNPLALAAPHGPAGDDDPPWRKADLLADLVVRPSGSVKGRENVSTTGVSLGRHWKTGPLVADTAARDPRRHYRRMKPTAACRVWGGAGHTPFWRVQDASPRCSMASRTEGRLAATGPRPPSPRRTRPPVASLACVTHPAAGLVELVSQSWSDRFEYFSLGASIYGGEGPRG